MCCEICPYQADLTHVNISPPCPREDPHDAFANTDRSVSYMPKFYQLSNMLVDDTGSLLCGR